MGVYYTPSARVNMQTYTSGDQAAEWTAAWKAALDSSGWAQSSDTGQLVPSTLAGTATVINQNFGYFIYYLNDSQHSTYPIYAKFNFLNTNSGTYSLRTGLTVQIGTATNGSGSITGWSSTVSLMVVGSSNTPTTWLGEYIGSTGEGYAIAGNSLSSWINISRMVDKITGNVSTNGKFLVSYMTATSLATSPNNAISYTHTGLSYDNGTSSILVPGGNAYGAFSTDFPNIEMYPPTLRVHQESEFQYQHSCHFHWDGEVGNLQEYDFAMLGTTPRHWRSFTNFSGGSATTGTSMSPSFLWEV